MVKKRGLGRGLDALLGGGDEEAPSERPASAAEGLKYLPVDLIQRGRYQPRRDFNPESLQELADSIAAQGVVQPIVVRPVAGDRFEIIAGERRWRAAQQAGLSEIPVVIRDVNAPAAMAMAVLSPKRPNGWRPTPMTAMSSIRRLPRRRGRTRT